MCRQMSEAFSSFSFSPFPTYDMDSVLLPSSGFFSFRHHSKLIEASPALQTAQEGSPASCPKYIPDLSHFDKYSFPSPKVIASPPLVTHFEELLSSPAGLFSKQASAEPSQGSATESSAMRSKLAATGSPLRQWNSILRTYIKCGYLFIMGLFHVAWNSFHRAAHLGTGEKICPTPLDKSQEKVICAFLSLFNC